MARKKHKEKKGVSLAKGPVGLIGLVLLAYGITALIFGGHGFTQNAPTGAVHGSKWIGLEVNGWSDLLFIAAGLLLLFGSPLHWGAKFMSLIVGVALVVVCLIALANGHGALGLFAANGLTELVWAAAGVLLIVLSLLPRVGRKTRRREEPGYVERPQATGRVEREPRTARREPVSEQSTGSHVVTPASSRTPEGRERDYDQPES